MNFFLIKAYKDLSFDNHQLKDDETIRLELT